LPKPPLQVWRRLLIVLTLAAQLFIAWYDLIALASGFAGQATVRHGRSISGGLCFSPYSSIHLAAACCRVC